MILKNPDLFLFFTNKYQLMKKAKANDLFLVITGIITSGANIIFNCSVIRPMKSRKNTASTMDAF